MRCERCGEQPATIKLTQLIGEAKVVQHLCRGCRDGTHGYIDTPIAPSPGPVPPHSLVVKVSGPIVPVLPGSDGPTLACPICGFTLAEFERTKRFGCPADYDMFSEAIDGLLERSQGSNRHAGSVPHSHQERVLAAKLESARSEARRELEARLEQAIASEEYEVAARVRDELNELLQAPRATGPEPAIQDGEASQPPPSQTDEGGDEHS